MSLHKLVLYLALLLFNAQAVIAYHSGGVGNVGQADPILLLAFIGIPVAIIIIVIVYLHSKRK